MKQKNKIQLLLVAAFAGLSVMCYAQGKVCQGIAYDIVSLQDPSDPSAYQWTEDGKDIGGASAAIYQVPASKEAGKYTYVRRSKKDGCDWASSNAYTVEVLTCGTITDGAANGTTGTFQDPRDKKVYKTVKMPDGKVWMAENLNYQSGLMFNQRAGEANGQPYTSAENGVPAIGSFWCPAVGSATLSTDKNSCNVYGALYTWETAMSPDGKGTWNETTVSSRYHDDTTTPAAAQNDPKVQGICPLNWHLPSDFEWATLLNTVDPACGSYTAQVGTGWFGSDGVAGTEHVGAGVQLKSASTFSGADPGDGAWYVGVNHGTDKTGFNALSAGYRNGSGAIVYGSGNGAFFWSSNHGAPKMGYSRQLYWTEARVNRDLSWRSQGSNVRCIKD
jgi:uncharacterized protein (TIGR02145 family)